MKHLKFVDVKVRLQIEVPTSVTIDKVLEEVDYDVRSNIPGVEVQAIHIVHVTQLPSWGTP